MNRRKFMECCACATSLPIVGSWAKASEVPETETAKMSPIDANQVADLASNYFLTERRTCSESILAAGCRAVSIESNLIPDIALGLGGGLGMQGETCGVLTGGALVVSLAVAKQEKDYKKKKLLVMQAVARIHNSFKKQFEHTSCRLLSGVDLTTEEGRKKLESGIRTQKCATFVRAAALLLADELKRLQQGEDNPPEKSES